MRWLIFICLDWNPQVCLEDWQGLITISKISEFLALVEKHRGSHLVLGVEPGIAIFAKGMTNGYPLSAAIGRKNI